MFGLALMVDEIAIHAATGLWLNSATKSVLDPIKAFVL